MTDNVIETYQRQFANWFGVAHAFAFWKGRVALYAILKALGVAPGDEIILPGYTCVMVPNPIKYLAATPVYVDIEPVTYNLDPALIPPKLTGRTKAIIVQHTYGYPADLVPILDLAQQAGVPVVEDCCLAFGSKYRGQLAGTFGQAAYFSFQWNKPYTSGLGGMAITDDPALAAKIETIYRQELNPPTPREVTLLYLQLAVYRAAVYPETTTLIQTLFRWLTQKGLALGSSNPGEFQPTMPAGFFKGMSLAQARSGLRQLAQIGPNLTHRRAMQGLYDRLLVERGWPLPQLPADIEPVLVRYPIRVADKTLALREAARHLVELGSWFESPLHPQETPLAQYDYQPGSCPEAERASREVINLPTHRRTNARTARRVVDFVAGVGPAGQPPARVPQLYPGLMA